MPKPDFNRIREHYRRNTMAIYEAGRSDWGVDVYAWDHECGITLTPIEQALWSDIRSVGVVMYPQYPVAQFFVDFANPVARVAIVWRSSAMAPPFTPTAGKTLRDRP